VIEGCLFAPAAPSRGRQTLMFGSLTGVLLTAESLIRTRLYPGRYYLTWICLPEEGEVSALFRPHKSLRPHGAQVLPNQTRKSGGRYRSRSRRCFHNCLRMHDKQLRRVM
jgi:hypothetical protein